MSEHDVIIVERDELILATIQGVRASAELMHIYDMNSPFVKDLPQGNWLYFNRLINQSGTDGIGTELLDAVLTYCGAHKYSIICDVNAYGEMPQKALEDWYISKGFKPRNFTQFRNSELIWMPE